MTVEQKDNQLSKEGTRFSLWRTGKVLCTERQHFGTDPARWSELERKSREESAARHRYLGRQLALSWVGIDRYVTAFIQRCRT